MSWAFLSGENLEAVTDWDFTINSRRFLKRLQSPVEIITAQNH
ncbi:hypothetical protein BH18ACI2_BH18ACI2_15760 [soil metagenome]